VDRNTLRRRGTGLIACDPDAASPGYTLFAPLTGTGQAYLIRLDGTVAHQWDLPYRPGRHARLLRSVSAVDVKSNGSNELGDEPYGRLCRTSRLGMVTGRSCGTRSRGAISIST